MLLHVETIDYQKSSFPTFTDWDSTRLGGANGKSVVVRHLSAAPPGKHDVNECEFYESAWSKVVCTVINLLADDRTCLIWVDGPMERDGLPLVFPYVLEGSRYHVPEATFLDREGYIWSWISFDFSANTFDSLAKSGLNLDLIHISGAIVKEEHVNDLIVVPFSEINFEDILDSKSVVFSHSMHFEGIYILGLEQAAAAGIKRVGSQLELTTHT